MWYEKQGNILMFTPHTMLSILGHIQGDTMATKILLVEDDALIYRMYQKAFELEGFEIEIAEDGQKGLDKLATFTPDIILLDIMMPNMNGVEMLAKLKENPATKDIPTVVLTNVS